jgi:hypothetical protein
MERISQEKQLYVGRRTVDRCARGDLSVLRQQGPGGVSSPGAPARVGAPVRRLRQANGRQAHAP